MPLVLVEDGRPLTDVLRREHMTVDDVLQAAREKAGVGRVERVRWAGLETSGGISGVPQPDAARRG